MRGASTSSDDSDERVPARVRDVGLRKRHARARDRIAAAAERALYETGAPGLLERERVVAVCELIGVRIRRGDPRGGG